MKRIIKIQEILFFLIIYIFLSASCNKQNSEVKRYCLYNKYRNYHFGNSEIVEVIYFIQYEEWEKDSILNVYSYNDSVMNKILPINTSQLFNELIKKEKSQKLIYSLNFNTKSKIRGVHNLKQIKWFANIEQKRFPIYYFEYYPEMKEDDGNSNIYYNPNFGIIAEYSPVWDNLVLIDSIFSKKNIP